MQYTFFHFLDRVCGVSSNTRDYNHHTKYQSNGFLNPEPSTLTTPPNTPGKL